MYIERAYYENVGPIRQAVIDFPFEENGNPKPIILVGENGSGKSTVLSNIVDAFYEMAGTAFNNVLHETGQFGHQYYKTISAIQIHSGQNYMFSFASFTDTKPIYYICKSGKIEAQTVKQKVGVPEANIQWEDDNDNYKTTIIDKENAEKIWNSNVICFFGPDRYERPAWMGDRYYESSEYMHPSIPEKVYGYLDKPISVKNVTSPNLSWLLDVIADSRPDVKKTGEKLSIEHVGINDLLLLGQGRRNLETVLSKILGEDIYFALNFRNSRNSRFKIMKKSDNTVIAPTLDSLSTGQIALFNLFSTIVRYGDINDINKSITLADIEGIVVIDEIELHLHTKLQKEVLPELIKLFPKVQFVITTHAPLFLLGMKDTFGEDHFAIYELPTAKRINTEKFSEFKKAFEYLKTTETFLDDMEAALCAIKPKEKPFIVTEGSTDWKHMEAALENLKNGNNHSKLFDGLDIEFFEYESGESTGEAGKKLKMGNTVLCELCENMAKIPQPVKYIFVADADDPGTNRKLSVPDKKYKNWGNNVYSLILPIPEHRKATPAISIEHYYTDDEIKTEWHNPETGISYRLFMGNEFDGRGLAPDLGLFCERKNKCGENSIAIIDGCSGEKVTSIRENNGVNYALAKSKFANMILNKQAPFDRFNFESFIQLFEIIKEIVDEPVHP